MNKKKIFIFEFVSGGGFNQVIIPSSLFCEGFGMLRSIIADFKLLNFEISILIDHKISFLSKYLRADYIEQVSSQDNYIKKFKKCVKEAEFCFIIAPEFSNILYDLTKIVKDGDKKLLSIDLKGIELGTSKIKTYEFFKANNINTPKTYLIPVKDGKLDEDFIMQKFNELKSPIVIKPDDGVGAENIYYLENKTQLSDLLYKNKVGAERIYILQEFIEGDDLSVSLIGISNQENPIILAVNSQDINIKNTKLESEYFGGYTPVENNDQISKRIAEVLKKSDLSNFNSYFGIDFIRKKDGTLYIIEINPRLTTSYIGLKNVLNYNLVEIILIKNLKSLKSHKFGLGFHSIFSRLELRYNGNKSIYEVQEKIIDKVVNEIPEIVTPPISFENVNNDLNQYSCFIATKEIDFKTSKKKMNEIIETLKKFNFTTKL